MKKSILTLIIITCSLLGLRGQGTLLYNISVPGRIVAHVYGADMLGFKSGNTATETPAGSTVYLGEPLAGTGWSAELFGAAGTGQSESALAAVPGSVTAFRTGASSGTFVPSTLVVPAVMAGGTGTFQLRVWDNLGGTLTSWSTAQSAWQKGQISAGKSLLFLVENSGTDANNPAAMVNFRSFNIIPEPTTVALLLLGGLGLWKLRHQ